MGTRFTASNRERIAMVRQLLEMFRFERTVYLSITVICVFVLVFCAFALLRNKEAGTMEITALFGSSGAITYTTGRILKMWSDAIKLLMNSADKDEGVNDNR
jgi:hypothetical protein